MGKVAYPKTLLQSDWDKKKPLIAKTKPTGIGKKLKALKDAYDHLEWDEFDGWATRCTSLADIDNVYPLTKEAHTKKLVPHAKLTEPIIALANQWAGKFTKEKLIPKSAATACSNIAKAAADYADAIEAVKGQIDEDYAKQRGEFKKTLRKNLTVIFGKSVAKCDLLLSDIAALQSKPNEKNLLKLVVGDGGARGVCTICKNWDQFLAEFPDLRNPIFSGKAMDVYFPPLQIYGANENEAIWKDRLYKDAVRKNVAIEDIIEGHRDHLVDEIPNVNKLKKHVQDLLGSLA